MVKPTPHYDLVKDIIEKFGITPCPVVLKPSPLDNFQVVSPTGEAVAYGSDAPELVDWVTDNQYLKWNIPNSPAN